MLIPAEAVRHTPRRQQRAVKIISPAGIGADQTRGGTMAGLAQNRTPVPATVVKCLYLAIAIARYQHRPLAHCHGQIAART